jgi:hypothetical protein
MAGKTKWTNADLVPEGKPGTIYGEWTVTKDNRKNKPNKLDELLAEGVTLDDIMRDATRVSKQWAPGLDDAYRDQRLAAAGKIQESYSPVREFVRGVRESPVAQGGLVAGSLIPSPLQPLFGAALTAESAADFAEQPGIMSGIGAAMGAIPGVRGAQRFVRGRKAAAEGKKVAEGLYRQTGIRRGTEVPYRAAPSNAPTGMMRRPPTDEQARAAADRAFGTHRLPAGRSIRGLLEAGEPQPTRVPMGATGDEYAAIREGGGPYSKNWKLNPEEAAAEDEFWSSIAALMGR